MYSKEDIKLYKELLSNLNKDNKKIEENIIYLKIEIEKEKEEIKELNDINEKKKQLMEKINYSKHIYDGILIKIQSIKKEIKIYEKEDKKYNKKKNEIK